MSAPPPLPPPPPLPAEWATRPRIRWGIPDVLVAWVMGLVGAIVASIFVIDASKPVQLVVVLLGQNGSIVGWLAHVARRKGLGSLRADFGLVVHPRDWPWFFGGVGLQLVSFLPTAVLVAAHGSEAKQDVVRTADRAHGAVVPLLVLAVALVAPLTEELLFRGALLRGLQRKISPGWAVFVSAGVFALVHVVGDPAVGSVVALPVIWLLGVVSAAQAVRTGNLSRSILLHVGFNTVTITAILLFS